MNFVKVAFLNVGHGDSSVIIFPDGKTGAVIDTPKAKVTIEYLNENKIKFLQWIIISHSHLDHTEGIIDVIKNFGVQTLYYNQDRLTNHKDRRYKLLLNDILSLIDRGVIKQPGKAADTSSTFNSFQNVITEILYPSHDDFSRAKATSSSDINDLSVVVQISFGKFSVLFTGDLSEQGWKWLKSRNFDLKSDILKYPHHGSWFKSIPELIDSVNPEYVILSYGETSENKYKLPAHKTTACLTERKIQTFSTKVSHQEFMITTELIKHLCDSQSLEV